MQQHWPGVEISFVVRDSAEGLEWLQRKGLPVVPAPPDAYSGWFQGVLAEGQPGVLVLDVRDDLPASIISWASERGILVVTIDDPSPRRLNCDLAFYASHHGADALEWGGYRGELFAGPEYALLGLVPRARTPQADFTRVSRILITMGGSDPYGMSARTVALLSRLSVSAALDVMIGPGFRDHAKLRRAIGDCPLPARIIESPEEPAELMEGADLAVASYGVTALELASFGVPAIHIYWSLDHQISGQFMVEAGATVGAGLYSELEEGKLVGLVSELCSHSKRRRDMSARASRLIDGRGAERIRRSIESRLAVRNQVSHGGTPRAYGINRADIAASCFRGTKGVKEQRGQGEKQARGNRRRHENNDSGA
ncbi:MAG: PseG/SpsG family protein [Acidobacteriota bacterium]